MHTAPRKRWMEVKDFERVYAEDLIQYEEPTPAKGMSAISSHNRNGGRRGYKGKR